MGDETDPARPQGRPALRHAPRSPFSLKVRVAQAELGLTAAVDLVAVDPWTDQTLRILNPLCQVPTLSWRDGRVLIGSSVIVQYLNEEVGGHLLAGGARRYECLSREAEADGMTAAVIRRFVESLDPPAARSAQVISRQTQAIVAVLSRADHQLTPNATRFDLGDIAILCGLSYLDRRSPELDWRKGRPTLAAWYEAALARPTCHVLVDAIER